MPRKKQEVEMEDVVLDTDDVEREESKEEELNQFIAENSESNLFATVYRKAANGMYERIGKYAISSCDLDSIAQEYGGGEFRVRIANEKGVFVKQFTTLYAAPVRKSEKTQNDNTLINMLIAQNQQNTNMLLKAIEVLGNRPQVQQDTLKPSDIVSLLAAMKQITAGQNTAEELIRGLELGLNLGEKSAENLTTVDRIVEALPTLANALQSRRVAIASQLRKLQQPPVVTAPAENTKKEVNMVPTNPMEARIFALLANLKQHVQSAEKGKIPAAMVVSYLVQNIDEQTAKELKEYLSENAKRLAQFLGIGDEYMSELVAAFVYSYDAMFSEESDENEHEEKSEDAH